MTKSIKNSKCQSCGLSIPQPKKYLRKPCVCKDYREIFAFKGFEWNPKTLKNFVINRRNYKKKLLLKHSLKKSKSRKK